MEYLVFTDLDGTLLDDETYSYREALHGLRSLQREKIPIIFCSSKTRAEQESLRHELEIKDPFIVENGGAIFFEQEYFKARFSRGTIKDEYCVIELGVPYPQIRDALVAVREELAIDIVGYGDSSIREVAVATGLSYQAAKRAMKREYEETLLTELDKETAMKLKDSLVPYGLTLGRGGRFHSVKGANSKGRAALALTRLFRQEHGNLLTVGIGDSWNDAPLLAAVHIPILVQRPTGVWENIGVNGINRVEMIGPAGWTAAAKRLLAGDFLRLSKRPNK